MAAFHGHTKIAKYLIEHGCDVNIANNRAGQSPLHSAVGSSNGFEMVKLLIEMVGTDVLDINAKNEKDFTPIMYAVYGRYEIMGQRNRWTHYDPSMKEMHINILNYLLEKGADTEHSSSWCDTGTFLTLCKSYNEERENIYDDIIRKIEGDRDDKLIKLKDKEEDVESNEKE